MLIMHKKVHKLGLCVRVSKVCLIRTPEEMVVCAMLKSRRYVLLGARGPCAGTPLLHAHVASIPAGRGLSLSAPLL